MKLKNKLSICLIALGLTSPVFSGPATVHAYTIDKTHYANRRMNKTQANYIIAHETATAAPARNVAIYMNRAWQSAKAYVAYVVGDGGHVYAVSPEGYVQWGAGTVANNNSPVQIELGNTTSAAEFWKDYPVYVNLLRDTAKRWGIPTTLDGAGRGIKSHLWVTQNIWGDHTDPYGYLAKFGVSKQKFAADLQTGLSENGEPSNNVTPQPTPADPSVTPDSGSYTFSYTTNIRSGAGYQFKIVGQYAPGQTVNYNGKVTADGYTWLRYTSYSGYIRYVAATGQKAVENLAVDGYLGPATTRALQRHFCTTVDGVISPNSQLIRTMQRALGTPVDGYLSSGYSSLIAAMQSKLGTPRDGQVWRPSAMVKEMQRRLNAGTLPF